MECMIDIKREGNYTLGYLPFDPKTEFGIKKGTIFVKCTLGGIEFKTKLMARGDDRFCIFFSKQLLKNLGLSDEEHFNIPVSITQDRIVTNLAEPATLCNDTIRSIKERASIRKFTDEKVSKDVLDTILDAGLCAPSAKNKRPFHFLVTQDRDKMLNLIGSNPYVKMLQSAAGCIIVCGDKILQGMPELLIEDCSAATQNILLAIHSLSLGGVWCGVVQSSDFYKDIVREFDLPSHIRPISLIAFGYPDEKRAQPNRFDTTKIHNETW